MEQSLLVEVVTENLEEVTGHLEPTQPEQEDGLQQQEEPILVAAEADH